MEADPAATAKGTAPAQPAGAWLRAQAALDWPAAGLAPLADWDDALLAALRLIAHAASPMALMIGRRGVLAANQAVHALFAAKAGKHINARSVLDVLPDSAAFYAAVLDQVFVGRSVSVRDQAIRLARDAQAPNWFNLDFVPVVDAGGKVLAALGIASSVTDQMQRLRALADSEQRLRLALEGSGMVGIWTLDIATHTSYADANVARMYGLPPADCQAGVDDARFVRAIHPDDRARVGETLAQAIATATPYRCRYRVLSKQGGVRWVVTQAKPALGEDGRIERMLGVVIDVTDQVETASALAESRFQFQTLTETLPQIVWSSDGEGRHDYFSARWSEFTGIALEDVTEETWKQLVDPEHWPMVSRAWDRARRTGEAYDIDYRFRHHTGEYRWLRVMALPMRDARGRITRWFGTSTDVHDAYLLAAERERLARELERIATEDPLTQVLTRRAFMERAAAHLGAGRPGDVGLLMLDVDHFKSINDRCGHPGGDRVLAVVAARVRAALKPSDLVGRLGGEEFAILLPACPPQQARRAGERIRRAIGAAPIDLGEGQRIAVTASLGGTAGPAAGQSLDRLLLVADKALYRAKSAGRDRMVFSRLRRAGGPHRPGVAEP